MGKHPSYCKCNKCTKASYDKRYNFGSNISITLNRDRFIKQLGGTKLSIFNLSEEVRAVKSVFNDRTGRELKPGSYVFKQGDLIVYKDVESVACLCWVTYK